MANIDSQMRATYQKAAQENRQINDQQAVVLIERAHTLNNSGSCSSSNKGNRSLSHLSQKGKDQFSPGAQQMISDYLRTGRKPALQTSSTHTTFSANAAVIEETVVYTPAEITSTTTTGHKIRRRKHRRNDGLSNGSHGATTHVGIAHHDAHATSADGITGAHSAMNINSGINSPAPYRPTNPYAAIPASNPGVAARPVISNSTLNVRPVSTHNIPVSNAAAGGSNRLSGPVFSRPNTPTVPASVAHSGSGASLGVATPVVNPRPSRPTPTVPASLSHSGSGANFGAATPAVNPRPSRPTPTVPASLSHSGSGANFGVVTPAVNPRPSTPFVMPAAPHAGSGTSAGGTNPVAHPRPHTPVVTPAAPSSAAGASTGVLGPVNPPSTPASTAPLAHTAPATPVRPIAAQPVVEGVHGKVLLDFTADKPVWHCHWFPMQERRADGKDYINNLYAPGGAMDKYDQATGASARDYEYKHNRKAYGEPGVSWFGHCNNASEVACLLPAVKRDVVYKGVKFTQLDIQGLLVKASPNLVGKVDFAGNRNNGRTNDDPNDPAPHVFIPTMMQWAKDGMPFVMDIDRDTQVWNYPYDKVKICESSKAPEDFDASGLQGNVKFYHIEMSGSGFKDQERLYKAYVVYNDQGAPIQSEWINTSETDKNPDFMWRPHPAASDLLDKAAWVDRGKGNNPEIDMATVFKIFKKAI